MQAQEMMLLEGDFARGIRTIATDADASFAQGDFATGMRARPRSVTVGTFATGQAQSQTVPVRGNFATGQTSEPSHAPARHPRLHIHEHPRPSARVPATEAGVS